MNRRCPYPSSFGRVLEVLGDLQERLAQQERTEPGREERHARGPGSVLYHAEVVFIVCRLVTIVTSNGIMSVARNTTKSVRLNGNSRNANA